MWIKVKEDSLSICGCFCLTRTVDSIHSFSEMACQRQCCWPAALICAPGVKAAQMCWGEQGRMLRKAVGEMNDSLLNVQEKPDEQWWITVQPWSAEFNG